MTVVLDASFLIAHLDGEDPHHDRAREVLAKAAGTGFAASVVTIAETLVRPVRVHRVDDARAALADLGLESVPLDAGAAPRLAGLRAETGLRLPDCCVIMAAEQFPDPAVATFDERLAAAAGRRGLTVA